VFQISYYFFCVPKAEVTNNTPNIIIINGIINFLTLSKANNQISNKSIHIHIQIFSSTDDFFHRHQTFPATFLLSSQTFQAVSITEVLASQNFFSKSVFFSFFSGILNNIML
jgi:hypothetical protein